jgi:2-(1,2-epoxy-1,2-dihydrophenyl)acetyl-CoA isomerase
MPENILVEVAERVATITLNRPQRHNALDGALIAALDAAVKHVAADPDVAVVILTGAAPPGRAGGFCAGGDVKRSGSRDGLALGVPVDALDGDLARHDTHASMLLHLMPKPTIAMIGGPAIGAGLSLAAACDLRFASADAVFAANFAPHGLSGDYGGSFLWTRIVGTATARWLYLLNEKVPADRALDLGMVHAVLPPESLAAHVAKVAATLAGTAPGVLARIKANLNEAEDDVERRRVLFAQEAVNARSARSAPASTAEGHIGTARQ